MTTQDDKDVRNSLLASKLAAFATVTIPERVRQSTAVAWETLGDVLAEAGKGTTVLLSREAVGTIIDGPIVLPSGAVWAFDARNTSAKPSDQTNGQWIALSRAMVDKLAVNVRNRLTKHRPTESYTVKAAAYDGNVYAVAVRYNGPKTVGELAAEAAQNGAAAMRASIDNAVADDVAV